MMLTRVYTTNGDLIREYPDAYISGTPDNGMFVWETGLADDRRETDAQGYPITLRNTNVNDGNWIACITGPVIVIEERQDDNRPNRPDVD